MSPPKDTELTAEEVTAQIDELSQKLERLRVRYEQYFLGIERMAPNVLRTDVVRMIHSVQKTSIRNTALKFRFRSLIQKFHSYSAYWNRTLREIENGTYRRHRQRAQRRIQESESRQQLSDAAKEVSEEETKRELDSISSAAEDFLAGLGMGEGSKDRPSEPSAPTSAPEPLKDGGISVSLEEIDRDLDAAFGARPETGLKATVDMFGDPSSSAPPRKRPTTGWRVRPPGLDGEAPAAETPARARTAQKGSGASETPSPRPEATRPSSGFWRKAPGGSPPKPVQPAGPVAPPVQRPKERRTYDEFLAAREQLGISKPVSFEKFQRSLSQQAERVRKTKKCRDVEFRVVVKDGKPFLKPVPKG